MKRSELKVGLEVEVITSKYDTGYTAVVVDTQPWQTVGSFQPRRWQVKSGRGVAVAVKHRDWSGDLVWQPQVIQLQQLKPAGTIEARRSQRRAELERSGRRAQVVEERRVQLAERLGLKRYQVRLLHSGSSVQLPTQTLEALLTEVEQLRQAVNSDDVITEVTESMRHFRTGAAVARRDLTPYEAVESGVPTESPSFQAGHDWQLDELNGPTYS